MSKKRVIEDEVIVPSTYEPHRKTAAMTQEKIDKVQKKKQKQKQKENCVHKMVVAIPLNVCLQVSNEEKDNGHGARLHADHIVSEICNAKDHDEGRDQRFQEAVSYPGSVLANFVVWARFSGHCKDWKRKNARFWSAWTGACGCAHEELASESPLHACSCSD
jgi:hypothetical protein